MRRQCAAPGGPAAWGFDLQRFAGERTLPPSPRRRQRARAEGRVPHSSDVTAAASFLAAAAAVAAGGAHGAATFADWASAVWGSAGVPGAGGPGALAVAGTAGAGAAVPGALGVPGTMGLLAEGLRMAATAAGPVLGAAAGGALVAGVVQTGFVFTLRPLQPDFSRISPAAGLQRLFSRQSLVEAGKAVLKFGVLALLVYGPCRSLVGQLVGGDLGAGGAAALASRTVVTVLLRAALVLGAAGAADFAYRRSALEAGLRMTRQEAREEQRETEGDPAVRMRRRRRAREMARRRMLSEVRRADVVVTNPTHLAVALRYDAERMGSPQVVAKGADLMAERVKAVARAAGVLIVENPPLARGLFAGVRVGQYIPPSLYRATAEVLAFVWRVRGRTA